MSLSTPRLKTVRSHEENQERAYVAASRRNDRSIEARLLSAHQASRIHKQRTGRFLRISERAVISEEMYEEIDELSVPHQRFTACLTSSSATLNGDGAEYVNDQLVMVNALALTHSLLAEETRHLRSWGPSDFGAVQDWLQSRKIQQQPCLEAKANKLVNSEYSPISSGTACSPFTASPEQTIDQDSLCSDESAFDDLITGHGPQSSKSFVTEQMRPPNGMPTFELGLSPFPKTKKDESPTARLQNQAKSAVDQGSNTKVETDLLGLPLMAQSFDLPFAEMSSNARFDYSHTFESGSDQPSNILNFETSFSGRESAFYDLDSTIDHQPSKIFNISEQGLSFDTDSNLETNKEIGAKSGTHTTLMPAVLETNSTAIGLDMGVRDSGAATILDKDISWDFFLDEAMWYETT